MLSVYTGLFNSGRKITQAAKFIDFFVHDILDYTLLNKNEVGFVKQMEVFDINKCVQEICMILSDKASMKEIDFNTQFLNFNDAKISGKYFIKTDQKRLQQVLLNLLSNAIKFTNTKSEIKIVIELLSKQQIRLQVIDHGIGIKNKDKGKIFKLFSSIKNEKRKINVNGIGLGLVISRMIVGKFHGEIDFTSTYKQGSTFFFTFEHVQYSEEELDMVPVNPQK